MRIFLLMIGLALGTIAFAQPTIGTAAQEINLPGLDGKSISLTQFKGKVVLVDFWASWCKPCRNSNWQLKSLYKKYNSKGFEIFGVSIDDNQSEWKKAVKQDKINWPQVIDVKASAGNGLTDFWGINYIPTSFLLDSNGKVIAVNPEGKDLDKLLKKLLL